MENRIELRFRDRDRAHSIAMGLNQRRIETRGASLTAAIEVRDGRTIIRARDLGDRHAQLYASPIVAQRSGLPDAAREETKLTDEERKTLAFTIATSGGMLLVSDDMRLIDPNALKLFGSITRVGASIDSVSANEPPLPADLMSDGPIRTRVARTSEGRMQYRFLNMGEEAARIDIGQPIVLAPHAAHIVAKEAPR
jgi:hypothetical protein